MGRGSAPEQAPFQRIPSSVVPPEKVLRSRRLDAFAMQALTKVNDLFAASLNDEPSPFKMVNK